VKTISGVFGNRTEAERGVAELRSLGTGPETINLLTGEATAEELASVPVTDSEQPGIIKTLGAVVGGTTGFASGYGLAALLLLPGGPIFAFGLLGGALLGALGGVAGGVVGKSMDNALSDGLPHDELFLYEDALRRGRSIVIVVAADDANGEAIRGALEKAGAETIDRAREKWWIGLRNVEKESYDGGVGNFDRDESWYRRGFETSLEPRNRGKSYEESRAAHLGPHPHPYDEKAENAFRRGYRRGQAYLNARPQASAAGRT
jgi:hypothetical protein